MSKEELEELNQISRDKEILDDIIDDKDNIFEIDFNDRDGESLFNIFPGDVLFSDIFHLIKKRSDELKSKLDSIEIKNLN